MTAVTAEADVSALDLIRTAACSPSCLLSKEEASTGRGGARCQCRCGGSGHGLLLRALTTAPQPAVKPGRAGRRPQRKGRRR